MSNINLVACQAIGSLNRFDCHPILACQFGKGVTFFDNIIDSLSCRSLLSRLSWPLLGWLSCWPLLSWLSRWPLLLWLCWWCWIAPWWHWCCSRRIVPWSLGYCSLVASIMSQNRWIGRRIDRRINNSNIWSNANSTANHSFSGGNSTRPSNLNHLSWLQHC